MELRLPGTVELELNASTWEKIREEEHWIWLGNREDDMIQHVGKSIMHNL